ncbi:MAG TPA: NUDIX hydrolase, partial [Candidatus Caccopulliclostridium gallistercoris]|nr:NUDIX hydrolase [Candidatus Caccopulliclostridium gallistercoris]
MGVFTWHNGEVPKNLKIKQVYGILFSEDGRTLLRHVENEKENYFSLAGGRPEVYDNGIEGTLRREVLEEVNCTIKEPILIGYQEVNEGNNVPPYAQVRMAAIIDKVGKLQPDPDNGET